MARRIRTKEEFNQKVYGNEPAPNAIFDDAKLRAGYAYYRQIYSQTDASKFLKEYLESQGQTQAAKNVHRLPWSIVPGNLGFTARMKSRNITLPQEIEVKFQDQIQVIVDK